MNNMKKSSLWMFSLLALLFVSGCGQQKQQQQQQQTTAETTAVAETTTVAPTPVSLEGDWKAVDFRDTVERTFLIYYGDANSRLKVTEAFQDIVPTLKITGTDVTYSYSADMNKYIDFYAEQNKDKYPTKEEATAILLGVREKKFESFKHQTGTFDNNTKVLTATLNDGVLNEKAKTIVFPEVPNIFGVLPLYINSTDVPITYHYELNGDILTIYAEKTFEETGAHLVYPMKFKKVSDPKTN